MPKVGGELVVEFDQDHRDVDAVVVDTSELDLPIQAKDVRSSCTSISSMLMCA